MNCKKIIAGITAGVIAVGSLSACSINIPFLNKEEETTAPVTTETTTAAPDYDNWKMAYSEYLYTIFADEEKLVGYKYEVEDCRFMLEDIDLNSVPELFISEGEFDNSKVNIYTYDGYQVKLIGSEGKKGAILYSASTGIIGSYDLLEDGKNYQETYKALTLKEGALAEDWTGVIVTADKENVPVDPTKDYGDKVKYYSGNEETTQADFEELFNQYVPEDLSEMGRNGYPLTEDNVIAIIEKGGTEAVTTEAASEAETEPMPQLSDETKALYADVLKEYMNSENYSENAKFTFAYIDDNDTPELLVSAGKSFAAGVNVYTIKDGEAVLVCVAGGNGVCAYGEKTGVILNEHSTNGIVNTIVYLLKKGEVATTWEGSAVADDSGAEEYSSNGETITKEEYTAKYAESVPDGLTYNTLNGKPLTEKSEVSGYPLTRDTIAMFMGEGADVTSDTTVTVY